MAKRPSRVSRGGTSTRPVWLRLGAMAAIFVALYSYMFISGHTTPKLGLDLQGGTSVTLTPKAVDANGKPIPNAKVPSNSIDQAVDIIRQRVNGLGVAEAEVVRAKNNIEISVPGKGRNEVVDLVGQTAQLTFRIPFTEEQAALATPTPNPSATTTPKASSTPSTTPSTSPTPAATPTATTSPKASGASPTASSSALGPQAAASGVPVASTSAAASAPSAAATPSAAVPTPAATATVPTPAASATVPAAVAPCQFAPGSGTTPPACITAQLAIQTCGPGHDSSKASSAPPQDWLVACDRTQPVKYILQPASLRGTAVSGASATIETGSNGTSTGRWIVNVDFTNKGQNQWSDLTGKISSAPGCGPNATTPSCQLAIVLDGVVVSSPVIEQRIAGSAQISGNFTSKTANDLASVLKYGALPVSFTTSEAVSVSATLGKQSLNAGLLAGAIGLALVILYSFLYYRAMGIVTVASLTVSATLTYACVVVLGQMINFTLTLAGIAGFIVAIGITADSFVVFYERLKDEVQEGRTVRASVERSWVRARRTILSADTVSFLAAAVLYWLSIGSVRGFAFTLGLSTILDLVVVFLFTKPLVTLLVRRPLFSTSRFSGLTSAALGSGAAAATGPAPRARLTKRTDTGDAAAAGAPPANPAADAESAAASEES